MLGDDARHAAEELAPYEEPQDPIQVTRRSTPRRRLDLRVLARLADEPAVRRLLDAGRRHRVAAIRQGELEYALVQGGRNELRGVGRNRQPSGRRLARVE